MFKNARIKLTIYYLLIIMVISVSFSFVIYRASANEVERFDRIQRSRIVIRYGFPMPVQTIGDPTLVEETERRIITTLFFTNVVILIVSGITGYILAGITLLPIKNMLDEQKRFISDASHEISTPLTSLKTAMEVFLRGKNSDLNEAKILIKESIDEVDKLNSLSRSLLQLAQFEIPNGHTKFENLNIKEIVNESIKKVLPLADKKEIKIKDNTTNIKFIGNKYSLIDLFVVLLDNAIKYSPKNSSIEIKSLSKKDSLEISVKDEGMGINSKDIPHIFDRFYRADLSRSKNVKIGGYGLGLSIAKKIVDNHKGTINIESKINKGTKFTVKLPR